MPPLVSVVIPTRNRAQMLCECVKALLASDFTDYDVYIIDDASTDDTPTVIHRDLLPLDPRLHCVRNERNLNLAGTRNVGASVSSGTWILFLDDDNIVAPDMLRRLMECAKKHPEFAQLAPLAIQAYDHGIWTLGSTFDFRTSMPRNLHAGKKLEEVELTQDVYPSWYSPNAWMVRRDAFSAVGGCDSFFRIMYDESDFGMRLRKAGYKSGICAPARTSHHGVVEAGCVTPLRRVGIESPERAYLFARNRPVFVRRFFPWWGQLSCFLFFIHAANAYYILLALRHRRADIAWAWFRGALRGLWLAATDRALCSPRKTEP